MSDVKAPPQKPAEAVRPLTQREFDRISQLAYEKFGLELKREKHELVSARLGKKARAAGCRSFQDYYDRVQEDRTGEALIELIDALTTNFTGFLREPGHFEFRRAGRRPTAAHPHRSHRHFLACAQRGQARRLSGRPGGESVPSLAAFLFPPGRAEFGRIVSGKARGRQAG